MLDWVHALSFDRIYLRVRTTVAYKLRLCNVSFQGVNAEAFAAQ